MRPASIQDRQVSFAEAERILGYERSSIYQMIKSGKIRAVKVGKFTRFYESELARFLDDNTRPFQAA
jgi:excisionase family DNA binding protein